MGTWQTSGSLTSRSWSVVRGNAYLLGFPLVAGAIGIVIALLAAGAGFALVGGASGAAAVVDSNNPEAEVNPLVFVVFVIAAYLIVLVTQFFMAALVFCANEELHERDSSFGAGVGAAGGRFGALLGWAAIQTLVGWLLSAIRGNGSDNNAVVAIFRVVLASLLSVAWTLITFFVLPFIVLRGMGAIEAIKSSAKLLKSTWGTNLVGNFRIGLILLVIIIPAILLLGGGVFLGLAVNGVLGISVAVLGAIALIVAQVISSAIRNVFAVALFNWATNGEAIGPFQSDELQGAIRVR